MLKTRDQQSEPLFDIPTSREANLNPKAKTRHAHRPVFAAMLSGAKRILVTLAAACGLVLASAASHASIISVVFTNLGGSQYLAEIAVTNDGVPASVSGFTLYFVETRFTNLTLTASPATWNSLLIPPDLGLPDRGFLDAFVLDPVDALQLGQTQGGFDITFDYIGLALPGAMAFDINDANYNVLFSGTTTDSFAITQELPEPGAMWLVLLGFGCMGVARISRRNGTQVATAAFAQAGV